MQLFDRQLNRQAPQASQDGPSAASTIRGAIGGLPPSLIRLVANESIGRSGIDAFWFGESDLPTPDFIVEAGIRAMREGRTFYTPNLGIPPLREAISRYVEALQGRRVGMERIAVTSSGISALMLASQLVLNPGDHVIAVTPMWPNAVDIATMLGAEVDRVPLQVADGRWTLDLERLLGRISGRTKMLIVNSPNNPTGWTMTAQERDAIFRHCRRLGVWILSDEVYQRLYFAEDIKAPSFSDVADAGERLFSVNSFSKAWNMTGWRLGWLVVPDGVAGELSKVIEFNTSCAPEFVQRAGIAALEHGEPHLNALRERLDESRRLILHGLASIEGVSVPRFDGAMYAFFRVDRKENSVRLAYELLETVGLGLAPGLAFGTEGEGWLRWCFAARREKLESGLERFRSYLGRGR
jgi:aspartate/methionine/tyrosine aminotransferase